MDNWKNALLPSTGSIRDAIGIIDRSGAQICLVTDSNGRLLGTVTDGDVRRGILRQITFDAPVTEVMKPDPIVGRPADSAARLLELMNADLIRQIPIIDGSGCVIGLRLWSELALQGRPRENWVVLMAGGVGSRLRPLTQDVPKPLLQVGHKPLLETILETFLQHEFRKFFIAVKYKADLVKAHFGDGRRWNCEIRYLEEESHLGTAGALSLLGERPNSPIIVMNGDVLTKVSFDSLLKFHQEQQAIATMCVREYEFQVPYGVVNLDGHRIESVVEKPVRTFFVNAGIYVLDPLVLSLVLGGRHMDMTDLFQRVIDAGHVTSAFPIREYWIDIGRMDDFDRANGDYDQLFG